MIDLKKKFELDVKEIFGLSGDVINKWSDKLISLYSDPKRYYHNCSHLQHCFSFSEYIEFPEDVTMAIWFHDAIYDTTASTNEEDSRNLFTSFLSEDSFIRISNLINSVSSLIMLSKHNKYMIYENYSKNLFLDLDLAILGEEWNVVEEYDKNIRKEYDWVPEDIFYLKRKEVLLNFIKQKHIYRTGYFLNYFEQKAQNNLHKLYVEYAKYS